MVIHHSCDSCCGCALSTVAMHCPPSLHICHHHASWIVYHRHCRASICCGRTLSTVAVCCLLSPCVVCCYHALSAVVMCCPLWSCILYCCYCHKPWVIAIIGHPLSMTHHWSSVHCQLSLVISQLSAIIYHQSVVVSHPSLVFRCLSVFFFFFFWN